MESVWLQNGGLRYKFKVDVLEASRTSLFLLLANSHGEDGQRNTMCTVVPVFMETFLVSGLHYIMRHLQGPLLFFSNICLCVNETKYNMSILKLPVLLYRRKSGIRCC